MGQKKNSKIILIIMILLIIFILLVGVAYAYFATDIFKSNKEMFFKYFTQVGDESEGFINNRLKAYFEKKETTPYTNNGTMALNLLSNGEAQKEYENINNFNISFSGETDKSNNNVTQNISLNYSNDVNFPISFRKIGNTIGLQTKYVGDKYVAVKLDEEENESLAEINDFSEQINKLKELTQLPFSKEELQQIQEKYIKVINEQLQDSQFTKIEEDNRKGYKLSLTGEQINNLIIQLLETLKNDQMTLDKINTYIKEQRNSAKITANTIDNYIKDIERTSEFSDEIYELAVFQERGRTTKIVIANQEAQIQIEKKQESNSLQYIISVIASEDEKNISIYLRANYAGLEMMQAINENYEVEINYNSDEMNGKYQYNNQVNFIDNITIENFSDENAMILNDYEEEQVSDFLEQVVERIQLVNKNQMEELGLDEDENPIIQIISIPFEGMMYGQADQEMSGFGNTLEEEEINDYNVKFENYAGTNIRGSTVKGLLNTIILNNENVIDDRQIIKEVHFDGEEYEGTEQNMKILINSIDVQEYYRIEFEKDEQTGMIYRAVINKK